MWFSLRGKDSPPGRMDSLRSVNFQNMVLDLLVGGFSGWICWWVNMFLNMRRAVLSDLGFPAQPASADSHDQSGCLSKMTIKILTMVFT